MYNKVSSGTAYVCATQDSPMLYRHRDRLTGLQRSTACRRRQQCLLSCTAAQTCEASICASCCRQPCVVCSSVCDRASARQRVTPPHERHACCKFAMLMCDRYLCSASREQSLGLLGTVIHTSTSCHHFT